MEKALVINSGSSSVKFKIYEYESEKVLCSGIIERIGLDKSSISIKNNNQKIKKDTSIENHEKGISLLLEILKENEIITDLQELVAIGHRVVQGADVFTESVVVKEKELQQIKDLATLAPLHNIPNAVGIETFQKLLPSATNVAVFDTEFHQTLPVESYMYAIPREWHEKYKVRRFGAHGTSHKYITYKISDILDMDINNSKFIICHLGNGASITAVKNGKSIQTSMGLTPLQGLIMGTRSGDIDPSIPEYLSKQTGLGIKEITYKLNHESGMAALSGISSDMRDICEGITKGDQRAIEALNIYATRLLEYIGSYYVRLGGIDALCFTAGVGENTKELREKIVNQLSFLGIELDVAANNKNDLIISTPDSSFKVMVVPTDEEYQILKETKKLC